MSDIINLDEYRVLKNTLLMEKIRLRRRIVVAIEKLKLYYSS
jgi:hypothetical protein